MNVRFTPRAESETEAKRKWWRENRDKAPDLFDDELDEAVTKIRADATTGAVFASSYPSTVRRVLMPKTKNNVFFAIIDGEIVILSIWGAPRCRGPKL